MDVAVAQGRTLQDVKLKEHLQRLRRVDNGRNLLAIARTWVYLAIVLGLTIGFDIWRVQSGLHWIWNLPIFAAAILCVGAGQHQLTALGHEASHHVLLTNRLANELVSDWLCMFPVFTTTYHYRLQHLAHHQFVNDPERDPNFGQLQVNGHWSEFPMTSRRFWKEFFAEMLPWNLANYIRVTAAYNALGGDSSPYAKHVSPRSHLGKKIGGACVVLMVVLSTVFAVRHNAWLLFGTTTTLFVAALIFLALMPINWLHHSRIHTAISLRTLAITRTASMMLAFMALGWLAYRFGPRVYLYFGVLWLLPLATTFSFFMMMRQLVQHSNGDRGWLTNTRIFLVNSLVRNSVLPFGQDYHLPHHLYASVPHYNLKELHELLMDYPEYRDQALVVANAVVPKHGHEYPTIVEMLGPDYAPAARHAAHVDNTVLDGVEVEEREKILEAARVSAGL